MEKENLMSLKILNLILFSIFFFGCSEKPKEKELSISLVQTKEEHKLIDIINKERNKLSIKLLEIDNKLMTLAEKHAKFMASKSKLIHSNCSLPENIAWNYPDEESVVVAWMNSEGHRKNILNKKVSKVGYSYCKNNKKELYWCVVFE